MTELGITFYEISNGLSGMKRDIILHLMHLIEMQPRLDVKIKDGCIRTVMGMCAQHIIWKSHAFFILNRKKFISPMPMILKYKEHPLGMFVVNKDNVKFEGRITVYFDYDFSDGIYDMKMVVKGYARDENNPNIYFGCTDERNTNYVMRHGVMYDTDVGGVCCVLDQNDFHHIYEGEREVVEISQKFCAHDGMTICVELNSYMKTMHFFVDEVLVPFVVTDIPPTAVLGFASNNFSDRITMKSIRLEKRMLPTIDSSVQCTPLRWNNKRQKEGEEE